MFGNIVTAPANTGSYPLNVQLGAGKARVPNVDPDALRRRFSQPARNSAPAQSRFKGEVEALRDGLLELVAALPPGSAIGRSLVQSRICGHQFTGCFVGVEVLAPQAAECRAADAALAGAI